MTILQVRIAHQLLDLIQLDFDPVNQAFGSLGPTGASQIFKLPTQAGQLLGPDIKRTAFEAVRRLTNVFRDTRIYSAHQFTDANPGVA